MDELAGKTTGATKELTQMENNQKNDSPDGVENLEQIITDPTARYDPDISNDTPHK